MKLKELIGSGDKIILFLFPFLIIGLVLNFIWPAMFSVGGPSIWLRVISIIIIIPGIIIWLWSVFLVLTQTTRNKLITKGPYAFIKHPLYVSVALLVLPWFGFLLNSWLGLVLGIVLYIANRLYSPGEEKFLADTFGPEWDEYKNKVKLPWL